MDLDKLHEQVLFSQVRVKTDKAGGSGTIIYSGPAEDGSFHTLAVTCHHVVDSAIAVKNEWDSRVGRERKKEVRQLVTVEFFDWSNVLHGHRPLNWSSDAEIVAYDADHDMALLKLRTVKQAPYVAQMLAPGEEKAVRIGSPCVAVGCALLHDPVLTHGIVTHMGDEIDNKLYWMSNSQIIFGNCLPGTERVMTSEGSKLLRDVKEGDFVISRGDDGWITSRVKRIIRSGHKEVFQIKTNTRTVVASANHPFLTPDGWRKVDELVRGDEIAVLTEVPGTEKQDPQWLWLVGFFLGDGSYRDRGHGDGYDVTFAAFESTATDVAETLNALGYDFYIDAERGVFVKQPKALVDRLQAAGITTGYAEKRIPTWVYKLDNEGRMAVLRGLVDSDGHTDARGDWRFELNNKDLLADIRDLAMLMGLRVSNMAERTRPWKITNQVGTTYSGISTSWSFVVFWQGREKSRTYREQDNDSFDRIKSIESGGVEEVFDLEIEGSHNFVASGVVVHNSGGAMFFATPEGEYKFLGIPSRIAIAGWSSPITHLGYFSPITRVHEFFKEQTYQFLTPGSDKTEKGCEEDRARIKEREERKLIIEAPEASGG